MINKEELYLKPFYKGHISYFETALILNEEGEVPLLFPIKKIIGVYSFGQNVEYEEGKDFVVTNEGALKRTKGSRMPFMAFEEYYLEKQEGEIVVAVDNSKVNDERKKNKFFAFGEGSTFTSKQICVTYEHEEMWEWNKPIYQGKKIKNFFKKLELGQKPTIVFFGDSITVGCNASGTEYGGNIAPFLKPWPILVTNEIEKKFNSKINYINTAVGGKDSSWGLDVINEAVIEYKPDLVVIAFGMNDGSLTKSEFKIKILKMINEISRNNSKTEFILISTTIPNPNSLWYHKEQTEFIDALNEIKMPNVAIVDMTNTHINLLKRKDFKDMTGNNVNHPNDYLIRIYAQMILGTIFSDR